MARYRRRDGGTVRFPHHVLVHLVAARYGQDPRDVDAWPADLFLDAVNLLSVTGD
jgi:hypothetical protein